MSDVKLKSPETRIRGAPSPNQRFIQRERIRNDSERSRQSVGSGSFRGRRPSFRRQSSLGLPHADSLNHILPEPEEIKKKKEGVPWWTSKRLSLSIVCFVGFFFLYAQRVDLSIAIVCMVTDADLKDMHTSQNLSSSTNMTDRFQYMDTKNNSFYSLENMTVNRNYENNSSKGVVFRSICPASTVGKHVKGEFTWNKELQGFILGAFFWGYTALQVPGGWLAERFGPRKVITIGMLVVSLLTILTPVCARASPYLLMICRVVIGIGEAAMYPGAQVLWAKWSPPEERSRLVGFSFGGCQLGNALAFPIGSLLCAYGFDGGWPSVFYVLGFASCLWCCVWSFYVRNSPEEMPNITDAEKKYILHSLGDKKDNSKKNAPKPWKSILTSGPVWAILIANACGNYGAYMLLTQMPTYMKEVLKFDIKANGVFSMIPYLVFWVCIILSGIFADFIISRGYLSLQNTRKLCGSIGMFVPAVFLVLLGYMDCTKQSAAVALLTLSMAFCGFQFSSVFINHGDIGPKYAGTIFGITNTGASVPGIIAPYVVGAITKDKTKDEWKLAFYIAALIYAIGAVAYLILAKGEIQPWAEVQDGPDLELENIKEEVDNESIEDHV